MLQLGSRSYELVQAQSGFSVSFEPERPTVLSPQRWRLDAHYVPSPDNPGWDDDVWEYLR